MTVSSHFGDIRGEIIDRLGEAKSSIRIAMAWFTNQAIFQVLLNKAASGIRIELVISDSDANFRKGTSLDFNAIVRKGMNVFVLTTDIANHFMHHKFVVIDDQEVITGSYNWSNNAQSNFENILILNDSKVAKEYIIQFDYLLKKEVTINLEIFLSYKLATPAQIGQDQDIELFLLASKFNNEVEEAMILADDLKIGLRMQIVWDMIRKYTAVGAAKRLSNDDEQSGFLKLIAENRADLTFEYLTAKKKYSQLFDKATIKHAKAKLRRYIGSTVNNI